MLFPCTHTRYCILTWWWSDIQSTCTLNSISLFWSSYSSYLPQLTVLMTAYYYYYYRTNCVCIKYVVPRNSQLQYEQRQRASACLQWLHIKRMLLKLSVCCFVKHGVWSGLCTIMVVPFKCLLIGAQIDLYFVQEVTFVGVHVVLISRLDFLVTY